MLPTITIEGRAVADPELRFTSNGTGVCNLRIAANDAKKLDDGTWENTEQLFVSAAVWNSDRTGNLAEHLAEHIRKGDKVIVTGRLYQREYETSSGEKRTSLELKFPTVAKVVDPPRQQQRAQQTPSAPALDPWGTPAGPGHDDPPF